MSEEDVFYLAGEPSPGLCVSVEDPSNPRKWDQKDGTGSSGASLVYQGDSLSDFTVTLHLWTQDHFSKWDTWKRLLVSPARAGEGALDAYHPRLAMLPVPIVSVVVVDPVSPKRLSPGTPGLHEVKIKLKQYRKPVPAQSKPNGSKDTSESDVIKDPLLRSLVDKVNELTGKK